MTHTEALKLALEALEYRPLGATSGEKDLNDRAIAAIKEALAQPKQEPVAKVMFVDGLKTNNLLDCDLPVGTQLYTTPPQRKPLPKGEWPKHPSGYVGDVYKGYDKSDLDNYAMQVLAAHGIKE